MRADFRLLLLVLAAAAAACRGTEQAIDLSDPAVKARVESAIRGRKDIDVRYVTVDVSAGVVTISGLVPSTEQRDALDRIVKRLAGVETLLDNLAIQD